MNLGSNAISMNISFPIISKVVEVHDHIVAYIHVVSQDGNPYVRMMRVASEYQRKGVGGALLNSLIQNSLTKQQDVALRVFKINTDARRFYERLGFEICGEMQTFYEMKRKA
jgi:ribosomal protein S18 acetylase RimI-like enzyme